MTNKVYQVPYGTKDILPGEMKTRRGIENAIINVFDKWGYDEVKTPDFEYVDTFGAAGSKGDFRFFDRSNNLLALRNDMTAPIARLPFSVFIALPIAIPFLPRHLNYTADSFLLLYPHGFYKNSHPFVPLCAEVRHFFRCRRVP